MKKILSLFAITALTFSLAACNNNSKDVVVKVNDKEITKDEFYNKMKDSVGEATLKDMIDETVLSSKYKVTDKEVNDEIDYLKNLYNYKNDDDFLLALQSQGIKNLDEFKKQIRSNLLRFKATTDGMKVTDKELKAEYENRKEQIKASHILVDTEEKALDIIKKINEGQKFEDLAKSNSSDTASAVNGGDLGYFEKGRMVKEFEDVAFSLKVGEISKPVKSQYGYHIIKVTDKKIATYKEMKPKLERELLMKQALPIDTVLDELYKKAKIDIKDKKFKSILEKDKG